MPSESFIDHFLFQKSNDSPCSSSAASSGSEDDEDDDDMYDYYQEEDHEELELNTDQAKMRYAITVDDNETTNDTIVFNLNIKQIML